MKQYLALFLLIPVSLIAVPCHGNQMPPATFNKLINTITSTLSADIVTLQSWNGMVKALHTIDTQASTSQQKETQALLHNQQSSLRSVIEKVSETALNNKDVLKAAGTVAWGTFKSTAPVIALTAITIASGTQNMTSAAPLMITTGLEAGLWNLVYFLARKHPQLTNVESSTASFMSKSILDSVRSLQHGIPTTPIFSLVGAVQAEVTEHLIYALNQHPITFDAQQFLWGQSSPTNTALQAQPNGPIFEVLKKQFDHIFENKAVAQALTTVTVSAGRGALIAAALQALGLGVIGVGLGFSDTTLTSAIAYAALSGGIEGLIKYAAFNHLNLGLVKETGIGGIAHSITQVVAKGASLNPYDVTPLMVQKTAEVAINYVVENQGGWANTFKKTFDIGATTLSSMKAKWTPIFKQKMHQLTGFIKDNIDVDRLSNRNYPLLSDLND